MRISRYSVAALFLVQGFGGQAAADAQATYDAIKHLGTLNGVALQCKYLDEVNRLKEAVVANAPKERSYGLAFDQATNDSFLAFLSGRKTCPGKTGFSDTVDAAIAETEQVFSAK